MDRRDLSGLIARAPRPGVAPGVAPGTATGVARIRRIAPNPAGGIDALWAIDGDFATPPRGLRAAGDADIPPALPPARRLRNLHLNDLHNHLCDPDPVHGPTHRLAQMVARVRAARAAAGPDEAVLFLSAGDDHTGTVLDELVGWGAADFGLDPGYRALSAAGLDAAAIGNHEVDRGAAQLVRGIEADAAFPLVSANIRCSAHLVPGRHYHAALLAQVKGLRVGIVGLTTRVETRTGQPSDPTLAVASPVTVLEAVLPLVAPISDVVVILSHCGYGDGSHASGKAAVARDIGEADFALAAVAARLSDRPTVVIGAHTHTRLNEHGTDPANLRDGVLIAQAECNGRFLGEVTLDATGVQPPAARLHRIVAAGTGPQHHDAGFAEAHVAPLYDRVAARMAEVIGQTEGSGLSWREARAARYAGECALANFLNDALVARLAATGAPVDLSLLNGASVLAGVDAGPVTFGQWFDVMPYSDEVFVVRATGREIAALLRSNAGRLLRPEEAGAVDPDGFVARGFLHASAGLRYRIALGAGAAAARACDIRLFGRPIEDRLDDTFTLAMTTYLALGSFGERWNGAAPAGGLPEGLPGFDLRALEHRNTGHVWRNLLVEHIRSGVPLAARCDGRLVVTP